MGKGVARGALFKKLAARFELDQNIKEQGGTPKNSLDFIGRSYFLQDVNYVRGKF